MSNNSRRKFLKNSIITGFAAATLPYISKAVAFENGIPDISVVTSTDYFKSTIQAIEQLGGISKFVPKGSRVGITINAPNWWKHPGSHTNTEVVLAILKLLNDAGAKEIVYLKMPADVFYQRTNKSLKYESIIKTIKQNSGEYKEVKIQRGVKLKKALIIKDLFDCDVFLNIPVNKHHAGTNYTNCLKNFMGNCKRETNLFFHNDNGKAEYSDSEFLSQCIADVNLVRKPDLCITDATKILKSNGPAGPGEIITPNKVFAGTDPVAMDAYGSTLIDYKPEEIRSTVLAFKHGLGEMDLKKIKIKQTTL